MTSQTNILPSVYSSVQYTRSSSIIFETVELLVSYMLYFLFTLFILVAACW